MEPAGQETVRCPHTPMVRHVCAQSMAQEAASHLVGSNPPRKMRPGGGGQVLSRQSFPHPVSNLLLLVISQ